MQYVKLMKNAHYGYSFDRSSSAAFDVLGIFLTDDVGCFCDGLLEWIDDPDIPDVMSNATVLKKEDNYIVLEDLFPEPMSQKLKITRAQYTVLLNSWRDTICKTQPCEVIIRYENEQFIFDITEKI